MTFDLTAFLPRAVMQGIPLLYGSTGEILTEKSGNLNLGIPGVMYVGGICGVIGAFFYEQSTPAADMNAFLAIGIPMLCSLLGSLLMGLLYCLLTVTLRANQNVTGLALTTFGVGIGNFFGGSLIKLTDSEVPSIALSATSAYFSKSLNVGGWFGQVFLSYGFLAYLAIVIALFASYFLKHTRTGLHLRAVGESAATADAAGINVTKYKYLATCIGSMIAGLGGLYYVMDYACGVWSNNAFGDRGWLAIALVIFTIWRPNVSVLASILFGGFYILYIFIPTGTNLAIKELYKMLPYVVTLVVLIIVSLRKKREDQPPASLGLSYFREERKNLQKKGNRIGCRFLIRSTLRSVAHAAGTACHVHAAAKNDQIHLRRARRKIERACRPPRRISIYLPPCAAQSLRRFYAVLLPEAAKHAIHYQSCLSFRAL